MMIATNFSSNSYPEFAKLIELLNTIPPNLLLSGSSFHKGTGYTEDSFAIKLVSVDETRCELRFDINLEKNYINSVWWGCLGFHDHESMTFEPGCFDYEYLYNLVYDVLHSNIMGSVTYAKNRIVRGTLTLSNKKSSFITVVALKKGILYPWTRIERRNVSYLPWLPSPT